MGTAGDSIVSKHVDFNDCHQCSPGAYLLNGKCELCPEGSYKNSVGPGPCHSCPAGKNSVGSMPTNFDAVDDCHVPSCPLGSIRTYKKNSVRILPYNGKSYEGSP